MPHNDDGGSSSLTESAGNGMTSPGHKSRRQGHSDTDHTALTFGGAVPAVTQGPSQDGDSINPPHGMFLSWQVSDSGNG